MSITAGLQVMDIGARVVVQDEVPGIVTGIWITGKDHTVTYMVAWLDGRSRNEEWLHEYEIVPKDDREDVAVIGFGAAQRNGQVSNS